VIAIFSERFLQESAMANRKEAELRPLELTNPVLVETVERALEPHKKRLSPKMIEAFRQEALLQLAHDPETIALVKKLRRRRETAQSYEEAIGPVPDEKARGSGTQGQGGAR
jgi:hypothetical protein